MISVKKIKKYATICLCLVLVISATGCGKKGVTDSNAGNASNVSAPVSPESITDYNALLEEADMFITSGQQAENLGQMILGEYYYGLAQADISSLRFAIDYILWLKGEGESLSEVVDTAPFASWEEIAAVSPSSPAVEYFEGLLYHIQGKSEEEQACLDNLKGNPRNFNYDFYSLKSASVEELYAIREVVLSRETELWETFYPRTTLYAGVISGAEYIPEYHIYLAKEASEAGYKETAAQCALNALLTDPMNPNWYYYAAYYGLDAGREDSVDILTEGVFIFPDDAPLNYLLGVVLVGADEMENAVEHLNTAVLNGDENLKKQAQDLISIVGGAN